MRCRLVDTRNATGELGGPSLAGQGDRTFTLSGACAIPATAKALAVNVTVTGATAAGNLRIHPPGLIGPTSTINYVAGQTRAEQRGHRPGCPGKGGGILWPGGRDERGLHPRRGRVLRVGVG